MMNKFVSFFLFLALASFTFGGCNGPQSQELAFETITTGIGGLGYQKDKPSLVVITKLEETNLDGSDLSLNSDVLNKLNEVDYDQYFAILLLQGRTGLGSDIFAVRKVEKEGNQVTITVEFPEPAIGKRIVPAFISPYRLIAVSKDGRWREEFHFVLHNGREVVAETIRYMP